MHLLSRSTFASTPLPTTRTVNVESDAVHQPVAVAAAPRRYYRPELDLLRAIAFLLVLTSHVLVPTSPDTFSWTHAVGGFSAAGVCLFFTLSAFLITELLLREQETTGDIHIRAFYARRILRIWPLYFLAILLGAIVPPLMHLPSHVSAVFVPYLLFCGNWAILLHGSWYSNPLVMPLWSISVEEQFYLIWPALVRRFRRTGILFGALAVLPIGWITDYVVTALHYECDPMVWINTFSQFQFFGVGAFLALVMHHRKYSPPGWVRLGAVALGSGCLLLSAYPFHFNDMGKGSTASHVMLGYMSLDAACVLLFCALLNLSLPSWTSFLVYLGKISYGLYVYHFILVVALNHLFIKKLHLWTPVAELCTFTTSLIAAIGIASLSYTYFEKPFLRFKNKFTFIPSRAA